MKRINVVLISLLCFALIGCASTVSSVTGKNELLNPSFESGLNDWGASGGVISEEKVHDGVYSLAFESDGNEKYCFNVLPSSFLPKESFSLACWVYLSTPGDAEAVELTVERQTAGGEKTIYKTNASETLGWQLVLLDVPSATVDPEHIVVVIKVRGNAGPVFIDDLKVGTNLEVSKNTERKTPSSVEEIEAEKRVKTTDEMPMLTNGGLEFGDNGIANNWGLAPGWDSVPLSAWKTGEESHSGSGALFVQQYADKEQVLLQADGWQDRNTTASYDPTKPGMFTAWVKTEGVDGGVMLQVERKYNNAEGAENVLLSCSESIEGDNGWMQLSVYVAPSELTFKEVLWDVVVRRGDGTVWIDDLDFSYAEEQDVEEVVPEYNHEGNVLRNTSLEELLPDGNTIHWDVWPGNPAEGTRDSEISSDAHSGEQALKINLVFSNGQAVYQYCVPSTQGRFDFDWTYEFSCYLKAEGLMTFDGKGVTIGIKRLGADGEYYNVYERVEDRLTSDWARFSIRADKAPVEIVQYDVIIDIGAGMGSLYIDDFALEPFEPETAEENASLEMEESAFEW